MPKQRLGTWIVIMLIVGLAWDVMAQQHGGQFSADSGQRRLLAVVVGLNQFSDSRIRPLNYCRADAGAVAEVLSDPAYAPFDETQVVSLLDEEATKQGVGAALKELAAQAREEDTAVVFFSSHGLQQDDGQGYWILYDTRVDASAYDQQRLRIMPETALAQFEIKTLLDKIRAKRMLVLVDCCFSAATVISTPRGKSFKAAEVRDPFQGFQGEGRVVITASDGQQQAAELTELGHGAFTYYLLQGLQGKADDNADNVVELWEMWRFLEHKVTAAAEQAGTRQQPTISSTQLTHGFPLSTYPLQSETQSSGHQASPRTDLKWVDIGRTSQGRVSISAHEVSNQQYLAFVQANPGWRKTRIKQSYQDGDYLKDWPAWDAYPAGQGEHPVTSVSWFAAKAYAEWVGGSLPSEALWPQAALGPPPASGPDRIYPWGDSWQPGRCNASGSNGETLPVQSLEQGTVFWSDGALYHLSGNVWEWCDDLVFAYQDQAGLKSIAVQPVSAEQNPQVNRLIKGGSFLADRLGCMISSRIWADPRLCAPDGGFRVLRVQ